MTRDKLQQQNWEIQCYGMQEKDLISSVERTAKLTDYSMIAMSMLSDAQEMIERDLKENARQKINQAKWVISEHLRADAKKRFAESL